MKTATFSIIAVLGAVALGAGGYWLGRAHAPESPAAGPAASAPAGATAAPQKPGDVDPATGRKVLYWHDPMVPGQRFDKPGKSPFMNMMLEPVYADSGGDASTVTINPRVQQNIGVRTADVDARAPHRAAHRGRQRRVQRARPGGGAGARQRLRRKAVRARAARCGPQRPAAARAVRARLGRRAGGIPRGAPDAGRGHRCARGRRAPAHAPGRHVGRADRARRRVAERCSRGSRSSAPIGGVVDRARRARGHDGGDGRAAVSHQRPGARCGSTPSCRSPRRRGCAPARRSRCARPRSRAPCYKGRVGALLPEINPQTRTIKARIEVANPGGQLVPGLFASVDFVPAGAPEMTVVPVGGGDRHRQAHHRVRRRGRRQVPPGRRRSRAPKPTGMTEIRKGIEPGQKVVVSGSSSSTPTRASRARRRGCPSPRRRPLPRPRRSPASTAAKAASRRSRRTRSCCRTIRSRRSSGAR